MLNVSVLFCPTSEGKGIFEEHSREITISGEFTSFCPSYTVPFSSQFPFPFLFPAPQRKSFSFWTSIDQHLFNGFERMIDMSVQLSYFRRNYGLNGSGFPNSVGITFTTLETEVMIFLGLRFRCPSGWISLLGQPLPKCWICASPKWN